MSDLRIGLVAEGKTDSIIIEAALKAILPRSFVLNLLQPESDLPFGGAGPLGGGWNGVYRWCRQHVSMLHLDRNLSLDRFDLIIVHIDADVARCTYESANIHESRTDLPCDQPCPPADASVDSLRQVILSWLDLEQSNRLPPGWVFCIPSKSSEAWLVSSLYGQSNQDRIMEQIECNFDLETWLSQRPLTDGPRLIRGGKKQTRNYRSAAPIVTERWSNYPGQLSQGNRFSEDVNWALGILL